MEYTYEKRPAKAVAAAQRAELDNAYADYEAAYAELEQGTNQSHVPAAATPPGHRPTAEEIAARWTAATAGAKPEDAYDSKLRAVLG